MSTLFHMVDDLVASGAQFVLTRPDNHKRPFQTSWLDLYPTTEEIEDHLLNSGGLGIVPASIGMATVDIDVARHFALTK